MEKFYMLNYTDLTTQQCDIDPSKWKYILLVPIPVLACCINLVVWLAATIHKAELLRQSYVYSCVTSTLLSNTAYLAFHIWDEVETFLVPDALVTMPPSQKTQVLWTLCKAGAISLLFVMCGNISALVYVMLDSTYFKRSYGATISRTQSQRQTERRKSLNVKRKKAALLIAVAWIVPTVLTVAVVLRWNCAAGCRCGPGSMDPQCSRYNECSRVWAPLKNSFIATNVALWIVEVVGLVLLIVLGIRNLNSFDIRKFSATETRSSNIQSANPNNSAHPSVNTEPDGKTISWHNVPISDDVFHADVKIKRRIIPLNPRIRLVVLLSILFIACTSPVILIFFVDVTAASFNVSAARIVSMFSVHLYGLLCPLLLVKYMASLRRCLDKLSTSVLFCFR